jgi:hypothetical protein
MITLRSMMKAYLTIGAFVIHLTFHTHWDVVKSTSPFCTREKESRDEVYGKAHGEC